ncbi:MAG: endolytic transglycosylase MltG [Gemmatimonadota bacterium]|nr:MAG: endolytic transglycosylase MltG [Gemmatimonadota bacterium]
MRTVVVSKGMDVRSIGSLLEKEGIISGKLQFLLAVKFFGKEENLQAGRYTFPERNSIISVLNRLVQGEVAYEKVTLPEGLTAEEVAHRFKVAAAIDSQTFLHVIADTGFIRTLELRTHNLEGYLFPSTYMVYWEMDPREIIAGMVEAFKRVFSSEYEVRAEELGLSVREVLTLASIIEREVMVPEERPIISAVFHNRLKLGRALESCATVEYALGIHKPRLTEEDLQVQSPYNTYVYAGLPPGPICNPGKASIEAALYPADVDYLYFVSEGNGRHIFSRSLEEHTRAKWRVRRNTRNEEK